MIPKIIHYCWLSNDPFPEHIERCMSTWQKYCPDYKIMKWDLSQFDIESSQWVKEAFESKKYAFAADYIRLYAIYTYGGIYLDSDISLNDSLDVFIDNEAFSVIEYHPDLARKSEMDRKIDELGHRLSQFQSEDFPLGVQAAIIGSEKRNPIIRELMNYYEGKNFINQDGSLNINPIAPGIYTRILRIMDLFLEIYCRDYLISLCIHPVSSHQRQHWLNPGILGFTIVSIVGIQLKHQC